MEPRASETAQLEPPLTGWAVPRHLLLLALPVIASMISRTVMAFVDFAMVSQLGTEAQAAITPAGILLFCVIAFGLGLLSVVNAFVAQNLGRREYAECGAYAWQGVYLSVMLWLGVSWTWFWIDDFFRWVGHAPNVQVMEITYVRIGIATLWPALAVAAISDFFNGIHRPAVNFWTALLANLLNAGLNYVLIFGKFGVPAMGIAGAAWGTAAATAFHLLLMIGWSGRPAYRRTYHLMSTWRPDWSRMKRVIWFGMPAGFQFAADVVAWTIFTIFLIGRFGTQQLAASNITFKFLELSFMPAIGLGVALTSAVGKAIGQHDKPLARTYTRWATLFAVTHTGLMAACYVAFGRHLANLFSDDPVVIGWAGRLLLLCAVFQVFDGVGIVHSCALRGAGDNYWAAIMMACYALFGFLGGGYLLSTLLPHWQSLAPWTAATAYIIALGLTFAARWRWGPWERIDLVEQSPKQMLD